jgi:hypothetical protein
VKRNNDSRPSCLWLRLPRHRLLTDLQANELAVHSITSIRDLTPVGGSPFLVVILVQGRGVVPLNPPGEVGRSHGPHF